MGFSKMKEKNKFKLFFFIAGLSLFFSINIVNAAGVLNDVCDPNVVNSCQVGLICSKVAKTCQLPEQNSGTQPVNGNQDYQNIEAEYIRDPRLGNQIYIPKDESCNSGLRCANTLTEFISGVIEILLSFAGSLAVLFVIIGGFIYITSAGNEERAEKGKKTLVNAIIGIVVIIMSYVIINVIINLVSSPIGNGY